jgi:hypothetical protein
MFSPVGDKCRDGVFERRFGFFVFLTRLCERRCQLAEIALGDGRQNRVSIREMLVGRPALGISPNRRERCILPMALWLASR